MRAILIILVTLAVLAGAFFAVVTLQSKPASIQSTTATGPRVMTPSTAPTTRPVLAPDSKQTFGEGHGAFVQSFDSKTGELSNEFRAERYTPQTGDVVDVIKPEARFYLGHGEPKQMLVIKGEKGKVIVPSAGHEKLKSAGTPTKGDLQQVRIELFQHVGDVTPQIICTMPNASFDNDQFRTYTDAYQDEKGNTVPGDQVPVHVTGQYEFDGRGLEITWNERDRRLQSLEIAHGERLIIRDLDSFKIGKQQTALLPLPEALVDADPKSLPPSAKKKPRKKPATKPVPGKGTLQRDKSTPVYRATFFDNVKIMEADQQIGTSNQLLVDFIIDMSNRGATQPSTAPAEKAKHTRFEHVEDEELVLADAPTTQPSKLNGPITVLWTGKLRVTQMDDGTEGPPAGEANIALVGSPVNLDRQGSHIVAAKVTYHTGDSGFTAEADDATPQVLMTDAKGMKITTTSIDYGGIGEQVIIDGTSHAELPIQSTDPAKPTQWVKADWNDTCALTLLGDRTDNLQIQDADLQGDVTIDHPQIHGRSDALNLRFEPDTSAATTQPTMTVKSLTASGKVDYTLTDDKQQKQSIQSETLKVLAGKAPDGKFYASAMNATGNVHTKDPERELFAGKLSVKLAPTTQPSNDPTKANFDVESLQAEENVRVSSIKGQHATADRLSLATVNGSRQVELIGSPNATVGDSESTLIGPIIRFDPDKGDASVTGAGSLEAIQKTSADSKGRKINAKWDGDLQLTGKDNLAVINGPVELSAPSEDGSINTATGDKLIIHLADAPATQPTTQKITGIGDVSGFSNKSIQSYSLQNKVEVRSVLSGPAGELLRRMHLFTDTLNYDQQAQKLDIPGPGRMLIEDNRKTPASQPTTQPTLLAGGNMSGATAFIWQRNLSYDEQQGRVELNGDVRVVHQGGTEAPFDVTAQSVSADLAHSDGKTKEQQKVDIKKMRAAGLVMFTSKQLQFNADEVEYDPQTHLIVAKAAPGRFAELYDQSGVSRGSFTQLTFNVESNEIVSMKDFRATVAR